MNREAAERPGTNTRIALFTLFGNQCAFPQCEAPMLLDGSLVGVVCHIHGQRPGSARYRADLATPELHSIDNLILLCGIHHKLVDDRPDEYPADRLRKIKYEHESGAATASATLLARLVEILSQSRPPAPRVLPPQYWRAEGAPRFDVRPNLSVGGGQLRLEGYFTQVDGDGVKVETRWRGAGTDTDFDVPQDLPPLGSRKYRMKSVPVNPDRQSDPEVAPLSVAFEVRFWWSEHDRLYGWLWPMSLRQGGKWQLDTTLENVGEPKYRLTLD